MPSQQEDEALHALRRLLLLLLLGAEQVVQAEMPLRGEAPDVLAAVAAEGPLTAEAQQLEAEPPSSLLKEEGPADHEPRAEEAPRAVAAAAGLQQPWTKTRTPCG